MSILMLHSSVRNAIKYIRQKYNLSKKESWSSLFETEFKCEINFINYKNRILFAYYGPDAHKSFYWSIKFENEIDETLFLLKWS